MERDGEAAEQRGSGLIDVFPHSMDDRIGGVGLLQKGHPGFQKTVLNDRVISVTRHCVPFSFWARFWPKPASVLTILFAGSGFGLLTSPDALPYNLGEARLHPKEADFHRSIITAGRRDEFRPRCVSGASEGVQFLRSHWASVRPKTGRYVILLRLVVTSNLVREKH